MSKLKYIVWTVLLLASMQAVAQSPLRIPIGAPDFKDWKNISKLKNGIATIKDQAMSYTYPDGKRYHKGFRMIREDVCNWNQYDGIRFWVYLKDAQPIDLDVCFKVSEKDTNSFKRENHAKLRVNGSGWHELMVPWSQFDMKEAQLLGALQLVKEVQIKASSSRGIAEVQIKNVELTRGKILSLSSEIKSKAAPKDSFVVYSLEVGNTTETKQSVHLTLKSKGWELMTACVEPSAFDLLPGQVQNCKLRVKVSNRNPEGARETQQIEATANGNSTATENIEFTTISSLSHPNVLHTSKGWNEVRDKLKQYDWAKKALADYEKLAQEWKVPVVATKITTDNTDKGMQLFQTHEEFNLMACGISYQLTGKKTYAEKIALFMRRLSDPKTGYPSTFRACHQSFVQEGHFFQHIAMAYDMVYDSGLFSDKDKEQIEKTFRLYIETVDLAMHDGSINNWKLSEMCGALYCALVLQDWNLVEKMYSAPCGIIDHLAKGVMNDGWWYECSVGYNVWCSSEFSQVALALDPWGINFKDLHVPLSTHPHYSLSPSFSRPGLYGMNFEKWGSITKNSICIKDMWDALPSFTDYRGVMFAVNDAQETLVSGQPYELAYYLFRDPEYAAIIRRGSSRDLLYGVPDLPEQASERAKKSAFADNMGIVMLRSAAVGREQSQQIQASLHYGTHGGFHGHFDRTNLLSLSRYGRSFYNPEMVWYGYPSYLYKFLVQTSMTKNMVVVDQKMQEPKESTRSLFYTGKMMQATEVETNARWSHPPYGGMIYDWAGGISFPQKAWSEGRTIPFPSNAPRYGELTDFTEPVQQRRLMLVTDDYVVLADYLKAEKEHTFDWLFQMKGFQGLTASKKEFLRHDAQMSTDPLSSAQFVTDCNWYKTEGTARSSFEMCWGKDCDNAGTRLPNSEDGTLKMDVFSVWPPKKEVMLATAPEAHDVNKQLWYTIETDGKTQLMDSTGAWILGNKKIDIQLVGAKELVLKTKVNTMDNPNVFWGDAKLILKDGSVKYLSELQTENSNIQSPAQAGKDFKGGPVKIGGEESMHAISGMPSKAGEDGVVRINLAGWNALRFVANLGCDYPLGNEAQRRKTYSARSFGTEASFISVIEPYEKQSVIKNVSAINESSLKVELTDGRIQEINISNLKHTSGQTEVQIREFKDGIMLRDEKTAKQ